MTEDEVLFWRLCAALESFDGLPNIGLAEPSAKENVVYDKLKAVLAKHAVSQLKGFFEPGRMHLVRRLAAAVRREVEGQ